MSDPAVLTRFSPINIADNVHLRLFDMGAPRLAADRWNARDVQSPYWRFYYNEDDGAYLDIADGSRYRLTAAQTYFVPAGVRFSCGNAGASFRHFYVHFDLVGLPRLLLSMFFGGPIALPHEPEFGERIVALAKAIRESPRPIELGHQCRAKALIYEGLAQRLESIGPEARAEGFRRAAALEPIAPALEFIEAHLRDTLRTGHLAALCCLSEDHFAHRFKACVGQTPVAYITERRATRAAQQLLFTEDSLDTIAEACGFGSRHYLTRVFTRATGIPPAAYRKSVRL